MIPFNKPFMIGNELKYIAETVAAGKISGDGPFTKKCHEFFEKRFDIQKALLTTSCTDALEMAAILIGIKPGDEVIMPSYTFVSTANAFALRGAKIVLDDSNADEPNLDVDKLEALINENTKAIVPVHYAGVSCDMDAIMDLAAKYNIFVIEDAAQGIDSYYTGRDGKKKVLGSIGHLGAYSFHETKNIISGEGGLLLVNDARFNQRAEVIREKGTNRSAFFRGEVDKYGWVDIGSSFLPSDIIAAFLYAQLEELDKIQEKRNRLWEYYYGKIAPIAAQKNIGMPIIPDYASKNAHMFYLVFDSLESRTAFISRCKQENIHPVFHYLSLHKSTFYEAQENDNIAECPNSDHFTNCLVRLPLYFELTFEDIDRIVACL